MGWEKANDQFYSRMSDVSMLRSYFGEKCPCAPELSAYSHFPKVAKVDYGILFCAIKVHELNSGTEASFSFFISNVFRSVKSV